MIVTEAIPMSYYGAVTVRKIGKGKPLLINFYEDHKYTKLIMQQVTTYDDDLDMKTFKVLIDPKDFIK